MKYTNSKLVSYTKLSPNHSGLRTHAIDTITIHCVVGQCTVESLGEVFQNKTRQASSNYGIGYDGRIGLYVEEKNRSWCTSSPSNDHRAITIEVASDNTHPYAVKLAAYEALIKLVADICKRNNIKKLVWSTNKNERVNHLNGCNMTVHRDYANKSCPGEWLYSRHQEIADRVNKLLSQEVIETPKEEVKPVEDKKEIKLDYAKSFDKKYSKQYTVTASALNMRAGAGTSKTIITCLPKNTKVRCYGYYTMWNGTPWLYVVVNNITGFVSSIYLK